MMRWLCVTNRLHREGRMRIDRRLLRAALAIIAVLVILVLTLPLTLPGSLRARLAAAVGVEATFRQTVIHTNGGVVEAEGEHGRTVRLDVVMDQARIEDILYLAVKSAEPPMSGALKLRAKLELPPGDVDPLKKLRLDGSFDIAEARFGAGGVQAKVNELSQKAQGEKGSPPDDVVSDLSGVYTVASEALDFRGTVRVDAKLSQLTSGPRAFLLMLVAPLFRRKSVTVVPITIGGTVEEPNFGLDVGRAFTPK
jgi:hypothetical protein